MRPRVCDATLRCARWCPRRLPDAADATILKAVALPLAASESAAEPARYELDSAKLIIDLAHMTFAAENDRTKSLDAKAGGLLGASGVGDRGPRVPRGGADPRPAVARRGGARNRPAAALAAPDGVQERRARCRSGRPVPLGGALQLAVGKPERRAFTQAVPAGAPSVSYTHLTLPTN